MMVGFVFGPLTHMEVPTESQRARQNIPEVWEGGTTANVQRHYEPKFFLDKQLLLTNMQATTTNDCKRSPVVQERKRDNNC